MRILWVKAGKLLPTDTGGKIRSYNLLRYLARRHSVTLLTYYGGKRDAAYEEEIVRHFPLADPVCTGGPEDGWAALVDYGRHLLTLAPYAVTKFTSSEVLGRLGAWFHERRFDVAVCDFLSASLNFPTSLAIPSVLFQHNVESILWQRQAEHEPNPLKRLALRIEAIKMQRYERATVRRFPHVIAVSERDRQEMTRMTDPDRLSVVPTGVDLDRYRAGAETPAVQSLVMFLGSMDWEANIDAVDHFCREIWPAIRSAVPAARFRIVGRNPHVRVLKLASESVEVTGSVTSVVDHLRQAAVVVVPLRIGGGTRLKIFEAMAAGKAVVSTSVGAEGLDVHDGEDVILADTASRFASAVVDLLRDGEHRQRLESAAARLAARFDWSVVGGELEAILQRVVRSWDGVSERGTPRDGRGERGRPGRPDRVGIGDTCERLCPSDRSPVARVFET